MMPLLLTDHTPALGIWKMTEPWQDMLELLMNKAIHEEDVKLLQSEKRKQEWLAVRLLIKHLTGLDSFVRYNTHGAPFLQNSSEYISISHTTGYAAVILSKKPHPGIDIEYRSERAWKLRNRFMNAKELEIINLLNDNTLTDIDKLSQQSTIATLCWCAKETAYKSLQETEVDFLDHLHIAPFTLSEKGSLSLSETKTNQRKTCLIHYWINGDFILTWNSGWTKR